MTPKPAIAPGGIRESASRRFGDWSRTASPPRRLADSLAIALALLSTLVLQFSTLAQGTAFTYQGELTSGGNPATGSYDLKFSLFDALVGGSQVGSALTNAAIGVTNGLFTVTLDFGSVFDGNARWLEIGVRTNGSVVDFTSLAPRQALTPSPYALYAPSAGAAASVPAAGLTGTVADARLSTNVALRSTTNTFTDTNVFTKAVGIDCKNPGQILQVGNANTFGSQGLIRLASRSTNSTNNRVWDIGVPQTGTDLSGAGYSFVIDDTQLGTAPEFIVHWGNGRVGIGRTNPATALDVNGTATATLFQGNGGGLTNLNAANLTGTLPSSVFSMPSGMTVVSTLANDPSLVTNGYRSMMTVPAPAWVDGATSDAPSARSGHTAIWDGHRFIIWGGTIGTGFPVNSGSMYYAEDNLWDPVSTIEAPSARVSHTAVWTGSEMIVWGGGGASGFLNTGGRFQPSPQGWQTISTNSGPAERSGHIAVWTGSRMLIWGGVNASGLLNDGALYNTVSNQWTPLALPGAPAARRGATAVWAGDRVLIWGGEGTNGVLNSGAQLTFSTGTTPVQWSPMNLSNAPTARRWHSAIWTGQKKIVWGGENAGVPLGDGAAFDPVANAWETVSSSGAPVARFNHAAVWTGQEMLIVAGGTGSTELISGAAYDPATARWRTLSSAGNAQARTEATVAWAGTEVLIFGGEAQGQCVASLQRLVPQPAWYFYRKL